MTLLYISCIFDFAMISIILIILAYFLKRQL